MPRYEDAHGTRLYVGHLSSRTRSRDLEHIFSRYGRVRDVDMKRDYAFVEFSDPRDADDARHYLDGKDVDGRRIAVEFAKGVPRGHGGVREYGGRGPPPGSGRCFNCGIEGHWARDCKSGDWKNKCYRCGERGHVERNCRNSPKKLSRGRSYSRSPVRSYRGRSRSRSFSRSPGNSRSRSRSRSRSPARRGRDERRSSSPSDRSPNVNRRSSPANNKTRKHILTPDSDTQRERDYSDDSPKESTRRSLSVGRTGTDENNIGYPNDSESPPGRGVDDEKDIGYPNGSESPPGPSRGGDDENDVGYPRGSESPPSRGGDDENDVGYPRGSESPPSRDVDGENNVGYSP